MSQVDLSELVQELPAPPIGDGLPKLMHLQILRAIAASLVVLDHALASLSENGFAAKEYVHPAYLCGDMGVDAFFVLSGLIMVRQSALLFGGARGAVLFAYRRITRVVPLYWIALLCWVAAADHGHVHASRQLLLSLAFLPNYLVGDVRFMPLLQAGWTLNYEMFFYLLFTLALFLPRRVGLVCLLAALELLVAVGTARHFPNHHTPVAILNFYTDPILMLFSHGVLIGFFEMELRLKPRWRLPFSPVFLLLIPPVFLVAFPNRLGAANLFSVLAVYSTAVVLLGTFATQGIPGRVSRILVLLGDASYSTYLTHLFSMTAIFGIGLKLLGDRARVLPYGFLLVVMCLIGANCFGFLVHLAIERPLIRVFRKIGFGTGQGPGGKPRILES